MSEAEPLKVLLADDTPLNLTLATKLLTRKGHSVVAVEDGKKAFEAYQKEKFDVVLLDLQMPEMNGIEAAMAIRNYEKTSGTQTPLIAMTASDDREDMENCKKAGMNGFISKPLDIKAVEPAIRKIIADFK